VLHYAASPPPPAEGEACEHPFCPCCFFTQNFRAFEEQIQGDGYLGIRFYAARDRDGEASADCRINGDDYEPGKESLRRYVAAWPGAGLEFRKQYVFLYTRPEPPR
jgi:hypothetical protein